VFGISFTELVVILVVALVVLGPERLPGMLRTLGQWIHKVRTITSEVRAQTGIDELLRNEGITGGLNELRSLIRGDPRPMLRPIENVTSIPVDDPYSGGPVYDVSRERPVEGPDAYGALPDDLFDEASVRSTLARAGASPDTHLDAANPMGGAPAATTTSAAGDPATSSTAAAATAAASPTGAPETADASRAELNANDSAVP
jgi:sec-independent protein translocase protein TatB